ncbi:NACHT, LRR and PYD domains-containing protein 12-like [Colossoma macropomum]|uniref:NACHT, LRR and PYD domains-containing protein 12-like n=1 Tax=Colossoma macropomum TaxID=42526 RepID=UPI001865362D|nr:NACHT, LRR and PYD domains-containing protein 12-like [Colossoma macropomum]XP_036435842.1 NACHT, LRR and PYD domains-containing protein 12-like [Colossoma macropomum]XP_036435843.1 NACHT, LRR and PYD domains-containing protein 12-like [Colossoma macropomum]XP_036435844.1 NACHT, LRR and PYD domains-containing protein 12-like [Colossoma macropomum]XP_036435845.1 NACHT, LRR and PYD domains-containing protein 12-like [Colossoma macropomum]
MGNIKDELQNTLENLELKRFQWYLINGVEGFPQIPKAHLQNADVLETVDRIVGTFCDSGAMEVTLAVLKKMNENQLAEELRTKYRGANIKRDKLKERENVRRYFLEKFGRLYDRISLEDDNLLLKNIYTELHVTEGCTGGVKSEHELGQIEAFYPKSKETPVKFSDLFKVQSNVHGIKVLTLGIAGVGKTAAIQKFILDWAENKSNQDLDFILFLPFRELNVIKNEEHSLLDLLHYFHHEICGENSEEMFKDNGNMIIILDGLDESKIQLDFNQKKVSSVTEKTTLDKLITNLIKGELLPSALIWITSRPAAASQYIDHFCKYFDHVTEICGFNDSQKEEYFIKRIGDSDQANRIISYIKSVRSLHILCHIPVFCKIAATVLWENNKAMVSAPTTLTEMYIHFLLFQMKENSEKYNTKENKESTAPAVECKSGRVLNILKLGELAFLQLQKGQLLFDENDLKECGIDVNEATVYSGVCTEIFKRLKHERFFSFVHLSFQEFLAAVYVFLMFSDGRNPLLQTQAEKITWKLKHTLNDALKIAVERAIESKNGHLDLFIRFLLGLSLQSNKRLLKALQPKLEIKEENLKDTIDYIKRKIKITASEKSINLFHCLSELKDSSLTSEIQNCLNSGEITAQKLSPTEWSALVFELLMSEDTRETFELRKYRPSDEGLRRLLPVVKNTRQALLDHCNLNEDSCKALASVFSSTLKELDLSNNSLQDSGVKELCDGLKGSDCKLQKLRLSGCLIKEKGCCFLASVMASVFSSTLKELDLSNNDLKDSGVQELCAGLDNSNCKLEILRLSGCMITEKGCTYLASALSSNPSHLKVLDLTYNHPGDSGIELLSATVQDPLVEHAGENRIKPGLRKYACKITLDPNTAHTQLSLYEGNRKVVCVREHQSYPDHPDRFDDYEQVLSKESLNGQCYWEAEWSNEAEMAVTYKGIHRKGSSDDCMFGLNEQSWSLIFSNNSYSVWHNQKRTIIPNPSFPSNRAGVYLDWLAGTLSFYSVSSDTQALTHLYTFHSKFIEPLYAGFRVGPDSPVRICEI